MPNELTLAHNELLKDTLPELPGAVRSVALRELRAAIREFFERSLAWVIVIEDTAVLTGDTEITISATDKLPGDDTATVIAVLDVSVGLSAADGFNPLVPLRARPMKVEGSNSRPSAWYVTSNPDTIKLAPYYSGSESLVLRTTVALMPPLDADETGTELPRQVELKWYDAIKDGFLARMYMHPNKPYSQPVLAQQLRHNFLKQIGFYAAQRKKGYNNTPAWHFPQGWGVGRRTGVISG